MVATTPSSTSLRAQSSSPLASPLVSHTTACMRLPLVPRPPRLLNAATAALNASPWSGFAAVGDVIGAIIPTFTTGPAALAAGAADPADSSGSPSRAAATATSSTRVAVVLRILMHPPGVRNPFTANVNHVPSRGQPLFRLSQQWLRPGGAKHVATSTARLVQLLGTRSAA